MEFVPSAKQARAAVESSLKGTSLIWPAISIGNVGQLCVDLLINSPDPCRLTKVGILTCKHLLPLVGYRGANNDQLTFALEVYHSAELGITVVQQRTPIVKEKTDEFCDEALQWIGSVGFGAVLILASSPAYRRADRQLQADDDGALFAYEAEPMQSGLAAAIRAKNVSRIDESLFAHLNQFGDERQPHDRVDDLLLPVIGTGISRQLFLSCRRHQVDVAVLYAFVDEGDNSLDGIRQADLLYRMLLCLRGDEDDDERALEGAPMQWKIPAEWEFVFGGRCDPNMYLQ